jgi:hypothetical protein
VFALERLGGAFGLLLIDELVPPHITADRPRDILFGPAHDKDLLDGLRLGDRVVGVLLECDGAPFAVAPVCGDEDLRLRVVDAARQGLG